MTFVRVGDVERSSLMKTVGSFESENMRVSGRSIEERVLRRHVEREEVGLTGEGWVVGILRRKRRERIRSAEDGVPGSNKG